MIIHHGEIHILDHETSKFDSFLTLIRLYSTCNHVYAVYRSQLLVDFFKFGKNITFCNPQIRWLKETNIIYPCFGGMGLIPKYFAYKGPKEFYLLSHYPVEYGRASFYENVKPVLDIV